MQKKPALVPFALILGLASLAGSLLWLAGPAAAAPNTQARLILSVETARPGETVVAGVHLRMAKGWHTYWRNGGDAGAPTSITWKLPDGVSAGEIQWPIPEKYDSGGLYTYVYHDDVVLLVPLILSTNLPIGSLAIQAEVAWLECEELCLPGDATVETTLKVGAESKPSSHVELIQRFQGQLPKSNPDFKVQVQWDGAASDESRTFQVRWKPSTTAARGEFLPYADDLVEIGHDTKILQTGGQEFQLEKQATRLEPSWPAALMGLMVELDRDGKPLAAYEVKLPGPEATPSSAPVLAAPILASAVDSPASLAVMLGLAFLGGLILNIMPCVLPVIALKILGFVNQSTEEPARVRKLGLVYAVGVLVSFLALASLVIGVQQAGKLASWGMQFQNPIFLVLITLLVLLVALNLFGVFEITLGSAVMGSACSLASREGYRGAFFNGVLATALATPCTAPFLGVALGFAFTQPPSIIVLMFLVVGLGLAAPYVLLSWFPRLLRFLPKPGPWMEKFKVAMGFPMLATAIWLFSILPRHYGGQGVLWVGLFMVVVAVAAWVYGQFVQHARTRRAPGLVVCLLLLTSGYLFALEKQLNWRQPPSNLETVRGEPGGIPWQRWSQQALAQAREAGHPVLVDFTADWCLTCKANLTSSIDIPSVREKLRQINAVSLLGDYTREDDAIAKELRKFGRAGVPLVLVYPANPSAPPEVLPALLTPSIVLEALEQAAQEYQAEK